MLYPGRCHCEAVGYVYRTERAPHDWMLRACQCSFCRAHGACTTSDPSGSVEFVVWRPESLRRYRFAHRITDFLVCGNCGVYVGATTEASGLLLAVVNTNALEHRPERLNAPASASYDGESVEARRERRRRSWTPCRGIIVRTGSEPLPDTDPSYPS